jgi:hypothetical protein
VRVRFLNIPNMREVVPPLGRSIRGLIRFIQHHHLEEAFSWIGWLLSVAVFAVWTHSHYRPPTAPDWVGMTIRTTVFAIWMLIVREWLMLRLSHEREQQSAQDTRDQRMHNE